MKPQTKSARIMELFATGKYTPREIAEMVDCRPEYVRVVARQRNGMSSSVHDVRYRNSSLGRATSAKYNERRNERRMGAYRAIPKEVRSATFKVAYRAARDSGLSASDSSRVAVKAVWRLVKNTAAAGRGADCGSSGNPSHGATA